MNARGRAAIAGLRTTLRGLGLVPDVVLVSSARRTLQTLEGLSPWDEVPITEPMDRLYLATGPQILRIVNGVADTVRSLMVIGHNPGLHDLAMALAGAQTVSSNGHMMRRLAEGFPTSGLAEFTIAQHWHELGDGGGRLVRFLCPDDAAVD